MSDQSGASFSGLFKPVAVPAEASSGSSHTSFDWRKDEAQQEFLRIQAVSGPYVGELIAKTGDTKKGSLTVEIQPYMQVSNSPSLPSSEAHASIQGKLTLLRNGHALFLPFLNGYFDSGTGNFKVDIPVQHLNGEKYVVELSGALAANKMIGKIEVNGYPESAGCFTLVKSGPPTVPVDKNNANADTSGSDGSMAIYSAKAHFTDGADSTVALTIMKRPMTPEQEFLDAFIPIKCVDVSVSLSPLAQTLFPKANWDQRVGVLEGQSGGHTDQFEQLLSCRQRGSDWDCRYMGNQGGLIFTGLFKPANDQGGVRR
jgi:hypothetical protein